MKKIRITTAGDAGEHAAPVPEPLGKEAGMVMAPILAEYRRRRLATMSQLEVGADGQADGGPAHLGHAAQVGQAGHDP